DPDIPQHWHKPLAQMRDQAIRMSRIVADLLELSRLEAAGALPGEQHVDMAALLDSSANLYADLRSNPEISVQAESQDKLLGSAAEIESVIRNLLSNAVRHTPPTGSIHLTWRTGPDGGELIVADNG